MDIGRIDHTAVHIVGAPNDQCIMVIGGTKHLSKDEQPCEIYDWQAAHGPAFGAKRSCVVAVRERIYMLGGYNKNNLTTCNYMIIIQVYGS